MTRRSVDEAYVSAGNSKDLRVDAHRRNDADVLIAAGWSPTMLGSALLRLHSEWDGAAKPIASSETDGRLLMMSLKTLPRVIDVVEAYCARKAFDSPRRLAETCVAFWLDEACRSCEGRRFERVAGTPMLGRSCMPCGGSGKRRPPRGEQGKAVLVLLDDCVSRARVSIRDRLRNYHSV